MFMVVFFFFLFGNGMLSNMMGHLRASHTSQYVKIMLSNILKLLFSMHALFSEHIL